MKHTLERRGTSKVQKGVGEYSDGAENLHDRNSDFERWSRTEGECCCRSAMFSLEFYRFAVRRGLLIEVQPPRGNMVQAAVVETLSSVIAGVFRDRAANISTARALCMYSPFSRNSLRRARLSARCYVCMRTAEQEDIIDPYSESSLPVSARRARTHVHLRWHSSIHATPNPR